jgi:hypothetical protein
MTARKSTIRTLDVDNFYNELIEAKLPMGTGLGVVVEFRMLCNSSEDFENLNECLDNLREVGAAEIIEQVQIT